jgi:hypothetical protein
LLTYCKSGEDLFGFVEADWGSNQEERKSYTGFAFKL